MKIAAMQPYFFPYIGYFQLIRAAGKFILYDNVGYIRHGWVNRNRLVERHRGVRYIGIPLRKHAPGTPIREIRIDNTQPWQAALLNFLWHNYRPCAAFEEIYSLAEPLLSVPYATLSEVNFEIIRAVCRWLSIQTPIVYGSEKYDSLEAALPADDTLLPDRKTRRVLALCRAEKADGYLNAPGGESLYRTADFLSAGLTLQFIHPGDTPYPQAPAGREGKHPLPFFPHLSILDVLMNGGLPLARRLLDDYTLSDAVLASPFAAGSGQNSREPILSLADYPVK